MKMNLSENKMDQFDSNKDKKKLSFFGRKKKIKGPKPVKKIQQSQPKQKLNPKSQQKRIQQGPQNPKTQKWVRKEPKPALPEEKLDYQQNIDYKKTYSRYIKEHPEDILVHWRGPEFEQYKPTWHLYRWATIAIVAIVFYALWTDSFVMAFTFVLIWIVGYLQLSQKPAVIDFAITYDGVLVGDELYDYDDIKSFWIFYDPPHTRVISLHMKGHLKPYLHIPLHQVDPVIVHEKLTEFVEEIKQETSLIDVVERMLHM